MEPDGEHVTFFVADTGIGIAEEHQQVIFEEFGQVQNHLQQRVKGTGLGLPLCRKLAALLGGYAGVDSKPGVGSTFFATLPLTIEAVAGPGADDAAGGPANAHGGAS
jgi:signal transduction histidine kinase